MAARLPRCYASLLTLLLVAGTVAPAAAQIGNNIFANRSVGGVAIDADGVLAAPTIDDDRQLEAVRQQINIDAGDLDRLVDLRAVSLRKIEETVARCRRNNEPIPAEVDFLAGLQRVEYVLVYPERQDIILAGPAEGWKVDALGNVVGATTNRSVLLLDDLVVALRAATAPRLEPISCSIDPTSTGVQRLRSLASRLRHIGNPDQTMMRIEEALGPQVVSVTGVPADSHFARAMVAADFRMKRLAMNFEPAPVAGLPSFLEVIKPGRRMSSMMPRWWLAPNYDPLAKTADGLAWQIRGAGVQCMTEEDHFDAQGNRQQTGKASPAAARWAALMTERFSELATHDSSFGQLRNVMDLAVVGTLIQRQGLLEEANLALPTLLEEATLASYPIPRSTASKASFVKKGPDWVISASGGVQILPWEIVDQVEQLEAVGQVRQRFAESAGQWWSE